MNGTGKGVSEIVKTSHSRRLGASASRAAGGKTEFPVKYFVAIARASFRSCRASAPLSGNQQRRKNLAPEPSRRAAALPMETPAVRKASGFAPARDVLWQREARPAHRMNGQPNGLARGEVFRSTLPGHPHPPGPNTMLRHEFRCDSENCNAG